MFIKNKANPTDDVMIFNKPMFFMFTIIYNLTQKQQQECSVVSDGFEEFKN